MEVEEPLLSYSCAEAGCKAWVAVLSVGGSGCHAAGSSRLKPLLLPVSLARTACCQLFRQGIHPGAHMGCALLSTTPTPPPPTHPPHLITSTTVDGCAAYAA